MLLGSFFPGTGLLILLIIVWAASFLIGKMGWEEKKFLWCLKLKVITNEVAAAWLHKPVMDFSPWASTFKAEDKNLVRPRVMYWYSRTTNQEIAFLHDQQIWRKCAFDMYYHHGFEQYADRLKQSFFGQNGVYAMLFLKVYKQSRINLGSLLLILKVWK